MTGGAGFLGQHTVDALLAAAHEVTIIDVAPPPAWVDREGVSYVRGDVRDSSARSRALAGAQAVIHAAFAPPGASRDEIESVNVGGTRVVRDAARDVGSRRLVVVSSTIVDRPLRPHPFLRNAPVSRLAAYRASRQEAESIAAPGADLAVAVVRPKTFVGPGGLTGFALVFDLVRRGGRVPVIGGGRRHYQLLDVRDLADAIVRLTIASVEGVFELGATRFGTVADDLGAVIEHAGTGARLRPLPPHASRVALRALELAGGTPLAEWHQCAAHKADSVVDPQRAIDELGWQSRWSNAESLVAAYDWYVGASGSATGTAAPRPVPPAHRLVARIVGGRS